ncbi:MAG: hypothetical protein R3F58_02960 [Steroidobacteraceae bacterium]
MIAISSNLPAYLPERPTVAAASANRNPEPAQDDRPSDFTTSKSVSLNVAQQAAARAADAASSDLVAQAVRRAVEDKASLTFRTQEGDIVKIKLTSRTVTKSEAGGADDAASRSISSQTKLSVRIKGDINADERAAIQSIVDKVETLARDFFNGDVQKAFAAAAELELDPAQLASFALKLRHRERTSGPREAAPAVQAAPAAPAAPAEAATPREAPAPAASPAVKKPATAAVATPVTKSTDTKPALVVTPTAAAKPAAPVATTAPAVAAAPEPTVAAPTAATPPAFNAIGKTIGDFLARLFDALEISLDQASGPRNEVADNAKPRLEFSASFKLQLFFQAVQALADESDVAEVEQDTSAADASDPVTQPGVSESSEPATTDGAIGVLEQVVDASLEQVIEAAPVEVAESKLSVTAMAQYDATSSGSFRMSLSLDLVA